MKASSFAETVLKLLGVYWIVSAVLSLPGLASYRAMAAAQGEAAWKVLLVPGLTLAAEESFDSISVSGLQAAAFAVLGVYLTCLGLAGTARVAANYFLMPGRETGWGRSEFMSHNWESIVSDCVYLVSGVSLFLGARGLAELWRRLRPMRAADPGGEAR
jgi:hypothetical protein